MIVPNRYQDLSRNDVVTSHVPTSADWQAMANNVHYLLGRGNQLMPVVSLTGALWLDNIGANELRANLCVFPRDQALDRYWVLSAKTKGVDSDLSIKIGNQAAETFRIGNVPSFIMYREANITGSTDTIAFLPFTASCTDVSASLLSIQCFEAPRLFLSAGAIGISFDGGVSDASLRARQAIEPDGTSPPQRSVQGVMGACSASINVARTAGILDYFRPINGATIAVQQNTGFSASSATPVHLSPFSAAVRCRKIYANQATSSVHYAAYVYGDHPLTTASLAFQSFAGEIMDYHFIGNGHRWVTGSFQVLSDGDSGNVLPSGRSKPDLLGVKLARLVTGTIAVSSLHIGEREHPIGLPTVDLLEGTFARTASGSFIGPNENGIRYALPNVLRLDDRRDDFPSPVLIETSARTNIIANSENLSGYGAVLSSISAAAIAAPDGGMDVYTVSFGAASTAYVYSNITAADNDRLRISFWVRGETGEKVRIRIRQRDGSTFVDSSDFTLPDKLWNRFEAVASVGTGASLVRVAALNGSDGAARDLSIWGFQASLDNTTSRARGNSYIRTSGSAASSTDETLTLANIPSTFGDRGFTVRISPFQSSADMLLAGSGFISSFILGFDNSSANGLYFEESGGTLRVVCRQASTSRVVSSAITFDADSDLSITVRPDIGAVYLQGFASGNGWHTGTRFSWGAVTNIYPGLWTTSARTGLGMRMHRYILGA
jgi:hypothetical protein